jgi:hypothetical protein
MDYNYSSDSGLRNFNMTFVQHCENCGAKIEIEDTDNPLLFPDDVNESDEEPQEPVLCENCAKQDS